MKVKYKDKELLESETFINFGPGETEVEFQRGSESIKLIFNLAENEKEKRSLNMTVVDTNTAKIDLINFNDPLGIGVKEPMYVGTFMHRKLYFTFFVKPTGSIQDCKVLTFSVYLGEEVQDGQN